MKTGLFQNRSSNKQIDSHEGPQAESCGTFSGSDSRNMPKLSSFPLSARLFLSLMLCVAGCCYLTLLGSIWLDTEWKLNLISEAYSTMGAIELTHHSFQYLFWFFGIFGFTGILFLMTDCGEKTKRFFAVSIPLLVLSDIGSVWLMRYQNAFAWQLSVSGFLLAALFFAQFVRVQRNLVFPGKKTGSG